MNKEDLLKEMRNLIGTKDPIEFFDKMVDAFDLLFIKIDNLETQLRVVKTNAALAIDWDPKIASDLIGKQIDVLRKNKDVYANELQELKVAYNNVFKDAKSFVQFWVNTLGYHPFLDYE